MSALADWETSRLFVSAPLVIHAQSEYNGKDVQSTSSINDHPQFRRALDQCIHCGLCLQNCPTYVVLGKETDSPRGRIQLMRAVSDGRIPLDGAFRRHLDLCLSCLSCQTACPSGVQYGKLIDTVRLSLAATYRPGRIERFVRWFGLQQFMPYLGRLRFAAKLFRLYQLVGLQKLVRAINLLPKNLKAMEAILPPLPPSYFDYTKPAPAIGQKRGAVAFFYGCLQDAFLGDVNKATIRVLQRNGYEVHFPQAQTCCGAAHEHTGDANGARALARRNIDAFAAGKYEAIINNAGGCGAMLKEYVHLLADDPAYAEKAEQFVSQVQDISEFLARNLARVPRGVNQSTRNVLRLVPLAQQAKGHQTAARTAQANSRHRVDRDAIAGSLLRERGCLQFDASRCGKRDTRFANARHRRDER